MPDEPREPEDVEAALLARAEQAVEAASDGGLTTRCAWCGRYRIDDRWLVVERVPVFAERRAAHGICDDCIAALKGAGLSV
jgi:hypothetical protein